MNFFSIEDDIALGKQLKQEILSNPSQYPVLSRQQHPAAYNYLDNMVQQILQSNDFQYRSDFAWEVYIVNDDNTLNAFAAPGGYIFVYTGLIKYLDQPDAFAGVLGHEMAHADRRHSTKQLSRQYGVSVLLGLLTGGDNQLLPQVLASLTNLKFSRSAEREADKYSVIYLCDTPYAASGAAQFFTKLRSESGSRPPQFLSTHPNPGDRVADITAEANQLNCSQQFQENSSSWNSFQRAL
ncbi:MAG: M48 family metalloprotease [Bacteroidota bacterium]